jgi:ABC-2 type transport system permease protein
MSTATVSSGNTRAGFTNPGFGSTLASEWTKLRSVRSTWIILALGILLSIGFSALMAWVTGLTWGDWGEGDQAAYDPLLFSVNGILFTIILLIVLAVTTATSEYSSKMIRTTFIATPQRLKVFFAKAILATLLGIGLSLISFLGMFLISQAIFGSYGLETASLGDSDTVRMLATLPVTSMIYILIPFCIGILLRGTASAITAGIGMFFLPFMLSTLLPAWAQENIIRFLPDIASDSLAGITEPDSLLYLSQGAAAAVIAAWIIGFLVLAGWTLNRRDA